jgi:hypothetical protein
MYSQANPADITAKHPADITVSSGEQRVFHDGCSALASTDFVRLLL